MRNIAVWMAASLALTTLSSVATAQTTTPTDQAAALPEYPNYVPETRWYGWQILASDAASFTVFLGSFAVQNHQVASVGQTVGMLGYIAAPAIIHAAGHGNGGKAIASASLRVLAPVAGVGVGLLFAGDDTTAGMAGGVLGGMLGAIVIDAAFLAHEHPREGVALGVAPMLDASARPVGMSLRGAF